MSEFTLGRPRLQVRVVPFVLSLRPRHSYRKVLFPSRVVSRPSPGTVLRPRIFQRKALLPSRTLSCRWAAAGWGKTRPFMDAFLELGIVNATLPSKPEPGIECLVDVPARGKEDPPSEITKRLYVIAEARMRTPALTAPAGWHMLPSWFPAGTNLNTRWFQPVEATGVSRSWLKASAGVLQPSVRRGRPLSRAAMAARRSASAGAG